MKPAHPFDNDWPVKFCILCHPKKKLAGPYLLAHLKFCHRVQWDNWHDDRGSFGISARLHVPTHLINAEIEN